MVNVVLGTVVCTLLTVTPGPAPVATSTPTAANCDGFGYVCGQTLPLCGCGCVAIQDSCMKDAKSTGLVAECVTTDGGRGYCAQ